MVGLSSLCNVLQQVIAVFIEPLVLYAQASGAAADVSTLQRFNKSELELKALRAQINPRFIFNCLKFIHHYIHCSDVSKASEYLIKF